MITCDCGHSSERHVGNKCYAVVSYTCCDEYDNDIPVYCKCKELICRQCYSRGCE